MHAVSTKDEPLVPAEEIEEKLGCAHRTLRNYLKKGLPHYRINSRVFRYRWSEVNRWVEKPPRVKIPEAAFSYSYPSENRPKVARASPAKNTRSPANQV
jgi:hypothetical protein